MSKKGIFGLVVIGGALIYGLVSVVVQMSEKRDPPTVDEARYAVTTSSRIYYSPKAVQIGENHAVMHGYWWLDNKVWRFVKEDKELPPRYGKVRVIDRRAKGEVKGG